MTNITIEAMAIEIVSFPMKNGGSFHSYVNVYQRVFVDGIYGTPFFWQHRTVDPSWVFKSSLMTWMITGVPLGCQ